MQIHSALRPLVTAIAVGATLALGACGSFVVPDYSADYGAVDGLKRQGLQRASVGPGAPEDRTAKVNQITLRGSQLTAGERSFAAYVARALATDLREAGLLDTGSTRRIDVTLLRNDVDISGLSVGTSDIEIELTVTEAGRTLLKKNYQAQTRFDSHFVGNVAIPRGQIEYPNLVRALLATIYRDPAFIQSLKP